MINIGFEGRMPIIAGDDRFIAVQGDNITQSIGFFIEKGKVSGIENMFDAVIVLMPEDGEVFARLMDKKVEDNGVLFTWNIKREDVTQAGKLEFLIKVIGTPAAQTNENAVAVWQSAPDYFVVLLGIDIDGQYAGMEPSVFEDYIARMNKQVQDIKVEYEVNDYRVGLKYSKDAQFVYTQNLKGEKGDKGDLGGAVKIIATLASAGELPAVAAQGDAYMVGEELYIYGGTAFKRIGTIATQAILPAGGATGQALIKKSSQNFDAAWQAVQQPITATGVLTAENGSIIAATRIGEKVRALEVFEAGTVNFAGCAAGSLIFVKL